MSVNTTEDGLSQSLTYEHHSKLNNKTLKCKVDFNEHGLEDIFEETVLLQVTNRTQALIEPVETMDGPTITIVAVICIVVAICIVVLVLGLRNNLTHNNNIIYVKYEKYLEKWLYN